MLLYLIDLHSFSMFSNYDKALNYFCCYYIFTIIFIISTEFMSLPLKGIGKSCGSVIAANIQAFCSDNWQPTPGFMSNILITVVFTNTTTISEIVVDAI